MGNSLPYNMFVTLIITLYTNLKRQSIANYFSVGTNNKIVLKGDIKTVVKTIQYTAWVMQ